MNRYIEHKKKGLLEHVKAYNKKVNEAGQFSISSEDLNVGETFCNSLVCKDCGKCCLTFPCVFAPTDFLDITNLDYMRSLLDTGILCISESFMKRVLLIRPRGVGDLGVISLNSQIKFYEGFNACLLCSDKGCLLPADYRPSQGLLHYPINRHKHMTMYDEKTLEEEYKPYSDILSELCYEYGGRRDLSKISITEERVRKLTRLMAGSKND